MKHFLLAAAALTFIGCNSAETEATLEKAAEISSDMAQMGKGIEISSAYVLPPFPGRDVAAGFFEITNHGPDDRLIAVTNPDSDSVEIHNHINEDGIMKMRKIDGVDLAKGETVKFRSGSFHIMMFGSRISDETEDTSLTFIYENADPVTLIVPVGDPDLSDEDDKDHSGH